MENPKRRIERPTDLDQLLLAIENIPLPEDADDELALAESVIPLETEGGKAVSVVLSRFNRYYRRGKVPQAEVRGALFLIWDALRRKGVIP